MFVSPSRLANAGNPYQGPAPRVLCVCSVGMLRSPTLAWLLSNDPWNYNTRSCGVDFGDALIVLDEVLLTWADVVICMEPRHVHEVEKKLAKMAKKGRPVNPTILNFNVPDDFAFRDSRLVSILREQASTLETIVGEWGPASTEGDDQTK